MLCIYCVSYLLFTLRYWFGRFSDSRLEYNVEKTSFYPHDNPLSKFVFESCNLLLEDETHPTRCHEQTEEHVSTQESRITRSTCIGRLYLAMIQCNRCSQCLMMYITTTANSSHCRKISKIACKLSNAIL